MHAQARLAALCALVAAAPGCIQDRCSIGDSARLLFVYSEYDPPSDTTNPHVFLSIQDAVDAAPPPEGDTAETTICVADGVYREQLTLPPGVRILGRGADRVRIRPPGGRDDETLVRVETQALTRSAMDGVDIGGTSEICFDFTGGGQFLLTNSRVLDCGTAFRAVGGGDVGNILVQSTPVARSGLVLDATNMRQVNFVDTDLTGNADLVRARGGGEPDFVGDPGSGGGVGLMGVTLADNAGAIVVSDSRLRMLDVGVRDDEGTVPEAPLVSLVASSAHFVRVDARTVGGRPLFAAEGGRVVIESSAWDGTDAPGGTAPVMTVTGSATLEAVHLTLLGDVPVLNADSGTTATLTNSIAWGQADAVQGDGDIDVRSSLLQDTTVPSTTANLPSADPDLDGWTPARTSPARCAADPNEQPAIPLDLVGGDRPFTPGKTPDVGAVEVQAACP